MKFESTTVKTKRAPQEPFYIHTEISQYGKILFTLPR